MKLLRIGTLFLFTLLLGNYISAQRADTTAYLSGFRHQIFKGIVEGSGDDVKFDSCNFDSTVIFRQFSNKTSFNNCHFGSNLEIEINNGAIEIWFYDTAPDTLHLTTQMGSVDRVQIMAVGSSKNTKTPGLFLPGKIIVECYDPKIIQAINLFDNMEFGFSKDANRSLVLVTYESIVKAQRDKGNLSAVEMYDVRYNEFKLRNFSAIGKFLYWVPKYWNNYGYNKEWPIYWAFTFLFLFSIINYFMFPFLNKYVYEVDKVPMTKSEWKGKRFWYSFFYTSTIFFKLTLKLEKINSSRVGWVLYIMLMYVLGVVCLAYMANFVIQK